MLLHTFDEALALSDYGERFDGAVGESDDEQRAALGRFFVLLVQRAADLTCRLRVWSLQLASRSYSAAAGERPLATDAPHFYPTAVALPLVADVAQLVAESECVYDAPITLDDNVHVSVGAAAQSSADQAAARCRYGR